MQMIQKNQAFSASFSASSPTAEIPAFGREFPPKLHDFRRKRDLFVT
jgi:hypothetical protein